MPAPCCAAVGAGRGPWGAAAGARAAGAQRRWRVAAAPPAAASAPQPSPAAKPPPQQQPQPQQAAQQQQQPPQQQPTDPPPRQFMPPPPPMAPPPPLGSTPAPFGRPAPGQTSHTQNLYSSPSDPITSFGFAHGFADKYELLDQLGSGTFGIVHIAVHRETGERFAVKSMPKRFAPGGGGHLEPYYVRRVRNEVDICNHLGRSLNVCYLYDAFEDDSCVDLVMELCTGGQLWDKIKLGSYSEAGARRLVGEMVRAVAQCHGMNVMLRDIKPENFLFLDGSPDSPLKAIDFGISVFCKPGQYVDVRAGTPIYIAPEVLRMHYTLSADIWSLGIVSYQLLTGRLPFSGEEGQEVSDEYMKKQKYDNKEVFRAVLFSELDFASPPWDVLSEEARDFVQSCLNRDEKLRPTAEQLLDHPWLQDELAVSDVPFSDTIVQRLQRFGLYGRFRQVALKAVVHNLMVAEGGSGDFSDMRAAFQQMDADKDGHVTYSELQEALQSGKFDLSAQEVEQLLEQIDQKHSGEIDLEEWVAAMADWSSFKGSRADWDSLVTRAFRSMEPNEEGALTPAQLEKLLCGDDGCEIPDIVEAALREADSDHDGKVDLEDFKSFMESKTDDSLSLFDSRVSRDGSGSDSSGSSGSDTPAAGGGGGRRGGAARDGKDAKGAP